MLANIEWKNGLGLLIGNFVNNIAHFSRDITWLYKLYSLGFTELITKMYDTDITYLVTTKYAASSCREFGDLCWSAKHDFNIYPFNFELLQHVYSVWKRHAHFVYGGLKPEIPICFDAIAQPWRDWVGGANVYNNLRTIALQKCEVEVVSKPKRKLVVAERASRWRRWGRPDLLREKLKAFGKSTGIEIVFVNFAALREEPCEQAKVLSDAAIFLGKLFKFKLY